MTYTVVPNSEGPSRPFKITVGLKEGYHRDAKTHDVSEVVRELLAWMGALAYSRRPYLTGVVTTGEVVYAWSERDGGAKAWHETVVVFSGDTSPLYNGALADEQVIAILNEIASHLGMVLNQTRVYIAFNGRSWILQREDTTTPTGEKV